MNLGENRPLYLQIEAAVQNDIREKKYLPGEKLPTEEELCKIYGVSKITIRKAFSLLAERGLVEKIRGKGTFVKQEREKVPLGNSQGFAGTLGDRGHQTDHSVLRSKLIPADEKIASKLQIKTGEQVYNIQRLMWEDSFPIGIDDFYASAERFPILFEKGSQCNSLYQLLRDEYGIKSYESMIEINGITATTEIAELLQCLVGDPIFVIEKTGYDADKRPFHYSLSTVRCDRVSYVVEISENSTTSKSKGCKP